MWKGKEAIGKYFSRKNSFIRFVMVNHFCYTQNIYKDKKGIYLIKEKKSVARVINILTVQTKYNKELLYVGL